MTLTTSDKERGAFMTATTIERLAGMIGRTIDVTIGLIDLRR